MANTEAEIALYQVQTIPKHMDFLANNRDKRVLLSYGGTGSGKSVSIALDFVFNRFYKEDGIQILVVRKTLPSLRVSAYKEIMDIIARYNLPHKQNKSNLTVTNGRNQILFRSLDDAEKLKSITGITYVWGEEATEFSKQDYMQLDLRCRGKAIDGTGNQLIYSFNPIDKNSFLRPLTENPDPDIAVLHSVYTDNPFLERRSKERIERLKDEDKTFWEIYGAGDWSTPTNIIFTNWDVVPDDAWPKQFEDERYGVDFGFASSDAAVCHIRAVGRDLFIRQLVYQKRLTVNDLKAIMRTGIDSEDYTRMMCDSARPDDIEELHRAGFNAYPCKKGPGSIKTGIQRMKQYKLHVLESASDIHNELKSYSWQTDKNDDILDKPVSYRDHAIDAIRYAVTDMAKTRSDASSYGTAGQMRTSVTERTIKEDHGVQELIDSLSGANGEIIKTVCRGLLRNASPHIIYVLTQNLGHSDSSVARRCDEMLEVLKARK